MPGARGGWAARASSPLQLPLPLPLLLLLLLLVALAAPRAAAGWVQVSQQPACEPQTLPLLLAQPLGVGLSAVVPVSTQGGARVCVPRLGAASVGAAGAGGSGNGTAGDGAAGGFLAYELSGDGKVVTELACTDSACTGCSATGLQILAADGAAPTFCGAVFQVVSSSRSLSDGDLRSVVKPWGVWATLSGRFFVTTLFTHPPQGAVPLCQSGPIGATVEFIFDQCVSVNGSTSLFSAVGAPGAGGIQHFACGTPDCTSACVPVASVFNPTGAVSGSLPCTLAAGAQPVEAEFGPIASFSTLPKSPPSPGPPTVGNLSLAAVVGIVVGGLFLLFLISGYIWGAIDRCRYRKNFATGLVSDPQPPKIFHFPFVSSNSLSSGSQGNRSLANLRNNNNASTAWSSTRDLVPAGPPAVSQARMQPQMQQRGAGPAAAAVAPSAQTSPWAPAAGQSPYNANRSSAPPRIVLSASSSQQSLYRQMSLEDALTDVGSIEGSAATHYRALRHSRSHPEQSPTLKEPIPTQGPSSPAVASFGGMLQPQLVTSPTQADSPMLPSMAMFSPTLAPSAQGSYAHSQAPSHSFSHSFSQSYSQAYTQAPPLVQQHPHPPQQQLPAQGFPGAIQRPLVVQRAASADVNGSAPVLAAPRPHYGSTPAPASYALRQGPYARTPESIRPPAQQQTPTQTQPRQHAAATPPRQNPLQRKPSPTTPASRGSIDRVFSWRLSVAMSPPAPPPPDPTIASEEPAGDGDGDGDERLAPARAVMHNANDTRKELRDEVERLYDSASQSSRRESLERGRSKSPLRQPSQSPTQAGSLSSGATAPPLRAVGSDATQPVQRAQADSAESLGIPGGFPSSRSRSHKPSPSPPPPPAAQRVYGGGRRTPSDASSRLASSTIGSGGAPAAATAQDTMFDDDERVRIVASKRSRTPSTSRGTSSTTPPRR